MGRAKASPTMVMALICTGLAAWYLSWLLGGAYVGTPALFGLLIAAETFNLVQAVGFWWTCSHQRMRAGRAPAGTEAVDVMIPVYDEPVDIVEPTVAAAAALHGADVRVWLLDDGKSAEMKRRSTGRWSWIRSTGVSAIHWFSDTSA